MLMLRVRQLIMSHWGKAEVCGQFPLAPTYNASGTSHQLRRLRYDVNVVDLLGNEGR